ncbi:MAG TPA: GatB/YqeY domain-containing protein [Miltoncostaeaceae bacterium]|nr:GatB/YqeY domain-containing protein [Miltoncostaeaceae bacterium]
MPDDAPAGLAERLDSDLKDAMRAGEKVRLGAIRRARAALKNAEIENRGALADDAAVKVLRGLVKQHRESIEQFRAGGRDDLVTREREEMAVLEAYLPAQMDEAAIAGVVSEVIASENATGPGDLGRVMKAAMARVGGQADGKEVRAIAQRLLEGGS